ncbi:aldo/keto reductase [Dongshaea marina]|uniref:aldo/keto reductase n=1 Tax=Dongshaea marina TaxID=2047966 RepID=UPI000D3EA6A4|nr:aldo/keto reductase [Dongshaea marina]
MQKIKLGQNGPEVSRIGLGCAGFSEFYRPSDKKEALKTISHALDSGINLIDTADIYGNGLNESLLSAFTTDMREKMILCSKGGIIRNDTVRAPLDFSQWRFDSSPEYLKKACDQSLQYLKTDYLDIYYLHSHDGKTPIEETMQALSDLVKAGKVKYIGLSNVLDEDMLKRAHEIHPITVIQNEYSLWAPESQALFPCLKELGIGFVAYSPLGRGALTGQCSDIQSLNGDDLRLALPGYTDRLETHKNLIAHLLKQSKETGHTSAQLALAWLLQDQPIDIIPIPGSRTLAYLNDNIAAENIMLDKQTHDTLTKLSSLD